ncbi:hypothetical protein TNCV_3534641 [Trichonephila clavipes]|nr:hypothetical protein TNCV_3534641 [Trichonephila clavipes]
MSAANIHHQVTEVYGTEAMSDSKVRKWFLKHSLGGKRFSDNEEVNAALNSWLSDQTADLFEEGFQNLVLSLYKEYRSFIKGTESCKGVAQPVSRYETRLVTDWIWYQLHPLSIPFLQIQNAPRLKYRSLHQSPKRTTEHKRDLPKMSL